MTPPTDSGASPDGGKVIFPWICDPGVTPCLYNSHCPSSYYCITGCCKLAIF